MLQITDKHTGKMKGMASLNTSTINNPFCQKMVTKDVVCKKCYANRMEKMYHSKDVAYVERWKHNGDILSKELLTVAPKINTLIFRFHAFGELLNMIHLENLMFIAKSNPNTTFSLWTKRKDIINKYKGEKPNNFILIYSEPKIDVKDVAVPKNFDKSFNVYSEDFIDDNKVSINCGARSCVTCQQCYSKDSDIIIKEKLK